MKVGASKSGEEAVVLRLRHTLFLVSVVERKDGTSFTRFIALSLNSLQPKLKVTAHKYTRC